MKSSTVVNVTGAAIVILGVAAGIALGNGFNEFRTTSEEVLYGAMIVLESEPSNNAESSVLGYKPTNR